MTHMNYVKKKKSIKCKFEKEIIITRQLLFKNWEFKVFSNVLKLLQHLCKHKLQINIKKNNLQCLLIYFYFYKIKLYFYNYIILELFSTICKDKVSLLLLQFFCASSYMLFQITFMFKSFKTDRTCKVCLFGMPLHMSYKMAFALVCFTTNLTLVLLQLFMVDVKVNSKTISIHIALHTYRTYFCKAMIVYFFKVFLQVRRRALAIWTLNDRQRPGVSFGCGRMLYT